jgi:Fur family ferric uptake transcriptional regulator
MAATTQTWSHHAQAVLDEHGFRRGAAREAIIDLLARQHCALSAQAIEDELRGGDRAVARASIYRVLEQLVEHGLVNRLEVGAGVAHYETIDPAGDHHHHLVAAPAGAALLVTARPYLGMAVAVGVALASTWGGLTFSYEVDRVPPSTAIIGMATVCLVIAAAYGRVARARPAAA